MLTRKNPSIANRRGHSADRTRIQRLLIVFVVLIELKREETHTR